MPSIRDFLGNDKIRELEFMGYSPYAIEALAKKEYELKKQGLVEKGISEKVAEYATQNRLNEAQTQNINEDANRGALGRFWDNYNPAKVLQTQAAKAGEFLFVPDELKGHTKAGEIIEENRKHFDKVKEANENWAIANPDKWNIASVAGRVAEGFTDPINLIPIASSANLGRKMFYYASTGALSGADSWARDENVAEGALYGGAGGAVLGPAMEYLIKGVSSLITKAKDARIKEATSQTDIDALNDNDFLKVDVASRAGRDNEKEGFGVKEYIDFYLHNSGEDVRKRVYDDYLAGKEKSVIDDEKFNDIKNFKSGIEFLSNPSRAEEYFAPLQMERDAVMDRIYKAKENSLTQYADMQKTTHKIAKENPNLNSRMLTELVNLTHKPTKEEAFITSLINNGQGVENRFSGYRILYAIENSFVFNTPTDMFYARLKKAGFTDEAAEAFTDSYAKKDLSVANEFIGNKVDAEGEKFVIDRFIKSKEAEARVNENSRAESAGEAGRVQNSLFDLGDNASRAEAGQAGDAQISQNGGPGTAVGSENFGRAKIDEAVEELGAVKFDDADNARFSSEQVVSKQDGGNLENEAVGTSGVLVSGEPAKTDYSVKVSIEDWVRELSEINNNELSANLFVLHKKHPELFDKPSDVYKTLIQIKNNPTHFFKNNRPDMALIAKKLKDGSLGKMAIKRDSGEIKHATKSTKERELKRLQNVNERELGVGSPYPTRQSSQKLLANGDGAKAHSLATNEIIPQNSGEDTAVGSKNLGRAETGEAIEEPGAVKFDDADNARFGSEQVVSKENFSIDEKIIGEWKKEFNLKSVYDDYIAQIPSRVKEILGGAVRLKFGSLVKLVDRKRTEFVSLIKPTLEKPDFVVKDGDGYIFIKDIGDKKAVFTSITKDSGGEYVVSSNSLKKISTLQNKIDSGAEVIFKSGEASNILAEAFTGKTFHAKPLSKDIIPQNGGYDTTIGNKQEENTGIIQTFIPQGSKSAGELGLPIYIKTHKTNTLKESAPVATSSQRPAFSSYEDDARRVAQTNKDIIPQNILSQPDIGGGLVSGTLNSVDEDGNFSPERFVAGFLAGIAGSKATVIALKKIAPKLYDSLANTAKAFSSKSTKEIRSEIEKINGIVPIKKFGENYAEFYHNGKGAVQKLLAEKEGQVAGAFFRKEIGDITLPWGEVGTGRSDGWGLAKIEKFHPEVLDKLEELIKTLPIKKETDGRFQLEDKIYKVGIRKEFDGYKQNWVLTAFEKDSAFASRTDFGKTPIKANVKTATSSDIVRSSGGLKPIEHSSDKGIISKKLKNGESAELVKAISSSKDIALKLEPTTDILSIVKDFSSPINTPIFTSKISIDKMLNHLAEKVDADRRLNYINLVKPTLENPLFITKEGDRYRFVKTFVDNEDKVLKFLSVIEDSNGNFLGITATPIKNTDLKNLLKGDIVWGGDTLSNLSAPLAAKQGLEAASGIISKKLKNGEDIDFSDKKVVNEIQKSVDSFVKDSLKDINVKDEILREFDLKNVKTFAKGKATELNEAQIKTLKKDIASSQIKPINENKFYFDKVGKDGDKRRYFVDFDESGAVRIDGFSKADIDEIPVQKSAMDELIGKDKLKAMSFEEKAAYHNELDPIKKEKIVKTAELNRLKREVRGIANVAFNDKKSTLVNKDLSAAEEFIKFEKGIESPVSKKGFGAEHIKKHLDPKESGFVTKKEYLKMGDVIRNGEMSLKDGKRIYEAYNDEGVRFRVIAGEKNGKERIISFFSNRKPGIENNTLTYNYSGHNEIINFKSKKQLIAERKLEEFKAKNLDEYGNIKDGLELC